MIQIKNRYTGGVIYKSKTAKSLRDAVIECADNGRSMYRANLSGANLRGANLREANLSEANLYGAKNSKLAIALTRIAPLEGSFVGWKKCRDNIIVKVKIPEKAKRSNAWTRKCRAEYVKVLEIFGADEAVSSHDGTTTYKVGKTVKCDKWDEYWSNECSGGIHFFMTREEAENW